MEISTEKILQKDVVVIGGGTAGCFAAISAAAAGADTLLIEKNGTLGGTMTVGGVNFPGLFFAWGEQIIGGPCWEMIKKLEKSGDARIPQMEYKSEHHWLQQVRINGFALACALDEGCKEAGVEVRLHTMLSHAQEGRDGVLLLVTQKEGFMLIRAGKVIDTTGDADLVRMLGYECMKSNVLQPATLFVKLSGYDRDVLDKEFVKEKVEKLIQEGIEAKALPRLATASKVISSLKKGALDIHQLCPENADTSAGRTELEMAARRDAMQIIRFLRQIPELAKLQAEYAAIECAVRETTRIVGEHVITSEEYITGVQYEDTVCKAFYPIDLHEEFGIKQKFFKEGICASIPYRALIPRGARHVLAAGRIISSDTDANSALRVQATCMAGGQAAGCAAAIAARQGVGVGEIRYEELMKELRTQRAVF